MSVVYPVIPVMQERGFSIQLGKFRVDAWHRTTGRRHGDALAEYAPRPLVSWRLGASAAICMMVAVSIGLATQHASANAPYSVTVAVPDAIPMRAPEVADAREPLDAPKVRSTPVARIVRLVPAPSPTGARPAPAGLATPLSVAASAPSKRPVSVATATHTAMVTGELQEWSEPETGVHGFVIAGEAEKTDHGACRRLSILTRQAGEADIVEQRQECASASTASEK